jgi:hypothetical protein
LPFSLVYYEDGHQFASQTVTEVNGMVLVRRKKNIKARVLKNLRELGSTVGVSGWLLTLTGIVLIGPQVLSAQHGPPSAQQIQEFAWRARTEANVGKKVPVPDSIFYELKAKDYDCTIEARDELETHKVMLGAGMIGVLSIQGHGDCLCSPTGNCDFWIYKPYKGGYRLILETGNVQIFGFLKSRTKGYPDLVTWSHGSAFDSEAQLFRFDGNQYVPSGGWEEEWEYPGENGEMVKPDRPRITSHFSAVDTIPQ